MPRVQPHLWETQGDALHHMFVLRREGSRTRRVEAMLVPKKRTTELHRVRSQNSTKVKYRAAKELGPSIVSVPQLSKRAGNEFMLLLV
jgi:hypothetical protein